jgi:hypothetical protein
MTNARATRPALRAFSTLPPGLQESFRELGFSCSRVESTGALAMRIRNAMPIATKRALLISFRDLANQYGLDLQRVSLSQGVATAWDDGSLLVSEADARGRRPPLFNQDGSPSVEILGESQPRQVRERG